MTSVDLAIVPLRPELAAGVLLTIGFRTAPAAALRG